MKKPICKLVGTDGNVFALASRVINALKSAGLEEQADEFQDDLLDCKSYDEALMLMQNYVEVE